MASKRNSGAAKGREKRDVAAENFEAGRLMVARHPMFSPLLYSANVIRREPTPCPKDGWAVVTNIGNIYVHPTRRGEPAEWAYVLAHCLLHFGFGHFKWPEAQDGRGMSEPSRSGSPNSWREWNAACDCLVDDFLGRLKLGRPPHDFLHPLEFSARTEERIYSDFSERGLPEHYRGDMLLETLPRWQRTDAPRTDWQALLGEGLVAAVTSAVNVAGGVEPKLGAGVSENTKAHRARSWFISSYPLLGALAASFDIVESADVCYRMDISVAAVDVESREIFISPGANLDEMEMRFVMAHELLHVGLRHDARCRGRDPELWNISCDYVINGWLVEMGVGTMPRIGLLYDPALKGMSAESIYDIIVTDIRRYRKLATLRGVGLSDVLPPRNPDWWSVGDGVTLDEYYRRALSQGLLYHQEGGRGYLPAGLIEEIRALSQPPIPWDVELAEWFDEYFAPLEKERTYARLSRRQSATPDIPRPRWVVKAGSEDGRTYGVVLDTSGSMDRKLLAKALGAIASYSISRDVPSVRVVFCDAATYDQGYMPPEDIAGRVKVKGRGGTILQPGIDLLEAAEDFPKKGPLLIITDGYCDHLRIKREHAFLVPEGRHLPFVPGGKVFRLK